MSARDELAKVIDATDLIGCGCCGASTEISTGPEEWEVEYPERPVALADAILAAGYRKPRTITTVSELDALPVNTAIIGTSHKPELWPGSPYVKSPSGEWHDYGNGYTVGSDDIMLPATITFEPEATA